MTNKEELLNKINLLSDSIRKKNLALKVGLIARNKFLEETFKPIVDPLNKLSKTLIKPSVVSEDEEIQKTKEVDTSEIESSEQDTETSSKSSEVLEEEEEENKSQNETDADHSVLESPTNITILSNEIGKKGPLSRKYILKMLHGARVSSKYHVYGARLENDGLQIGDSKLAVDEKDNILVKEQTFKGTTGLFELIFKKTPKKYTRNDLRDFKKICMLTNSHRKGYSPSAPIHRNKSEIYKEIIAKIFSKYRGKPKGKGMSMKSVYDTNVIYYNNVNKLVDRMRLLYESIQAGHNGLDNEMVALTEELKSRGFIK